MNILAHYCIRLIFSSLFGAASCKSCLLHVVLRDASVAIPREKLADPEPQSGCAAATGAPTLLPPGPALELSLHHSSCSSWRVPTYENLIG